MALLSVVRNTPKKIDRKRSAPHDVKRGIERKIRQDGRRQAHDELAAWQQDDAADAAEEEAAWDRLEADFIEDRRKADLYLAMLDEGLVEDVGRYLDFDPYEFGGGWKGCGCGCE